MQINLEKIYAKIISNKYELFDQEDTKEIVKGFVIYNIIMQSQLTYSNVVIDNSHVNENRKMIYFFENLSYDSSGILIIDLLDDFFTILIRMITNTEYDVKIDTEIIIDNLEKLIADRELCSLLLELVYYK